MDRSIGDGEESFASCPLFVECGWWIWLRGVFFFATMYMCGLHLNGTREEYSIKEIGVAGRLVWMGLSASGERDGANMSSQEVRLFSLITGIFYSYGESLDIVGNAKGGSLTGRQCQILLDSTSVAS